MDKLREKMQEAFEALVEAEEIAYAGGMRTTIGVSLIAAHTPLLRAINDYRAIERKRRANASRRES